MADTEERGIKDEVKIYKFDIVLKNTLDLFNERSFYIQI